MAIEVIVWFYLLCLLALTGIATAIALYGFRLVNRFGPRDTDTPDDRITADRSATDGGEVDDGEDVSRAAKRAKKRRFSLPDRREPRVRAKMLLVGGMLAAIATFFTALGIPLSSSNVFCGTACHNMNPQYQTWKRSSHARVTCTACHVDPTMIALAYEKLVEGPVGLLHTVQSSHEKPINEMSHYSQENLPRVRCKRCHSNENRNFTFSSEIKMDHKAHEEAEINCAVCHNRVTHLGAIKYEPLKSTWEEAEDFQFKNYLTMKDGCFRCHSSNIETRDEHTLLLIKNDKEPSGACSTCHTKGFKKMPEGHMGRDWRDKHGDFAARNFKNCLSCHDADKKYNYKEKHKADSVGHQEEPEEHQARSKTHEESAAHEEHQEESAEHETEAEAKPWCLVCHDDAAYKRFEAQFLEG